MTLTKPNFLPVILPRPAKRDNDIARRTPTPLMLVSKLKPYIISASSSQTPASPLCISTISRCYEACCQDNLIRNLINENNEVRTDLQAVRRTRVMLIAWYIRESRDSESERRKLRHDVEKLRRSCGSMRRPMQACTRKARRGSRRMRRLWRLLVRKTRRCKCGMDVSR